MTQSCGSCLWCDEFRDGQVEERCQYVPVLPSSVQGMTFRHQVTRDMGGNCRAYRPRKEGQSYCQVAIDPLVCATASDTPRPVRQWCMTCERYHDGAVVRTGVGEFSFSWEQRKEGA